MGARNASEPAVSPKISANTEKTEIPVDSGIGRGYRWAGRIVDDPNPNMSWMLHRPNEDDWAAVLAGCGAKSWSYAAVGGSSCDEWPAGFSRDDHWRVVGRGREDFERICAALEGWEQFPGGWCWMVPGGGPAAAGQPLCMVAKVGPLWWLNPVRVVEVIDRRDAGFFAVAQGTLDGHAAAGEEQFSVKLKPSGEVIYRIRAFSRPAQWMASLAVPWVRRLQRRFVAESMAAVERRARR